MAVKFSKILATSDTTKMPTTSGVTWSEGINMAGGSLEYLLLRGDVTWNVGDPAAGQGASSFLDTIRIIINGEVVHDFRSGFEAATAGVYGYFLNSFGGKYGEVVGGTTTREFYMAVPVGRVYSENVVRVETIVTWATVGQTPASGSLEWWSKMNDNIQTTTTVSPSTSFAHAIAQEQVVVRVPQNAPSGSVVSAILVQNDTAADELGSQGIRINVLSDYGIESQMQRFLNGDMFNGIEYSDGAAAGQTYLAQLPGSTLIQTYGLSGGDVVLQVDSSAATTRTYTPILTTPVGGKESMSVKQTQPQVANTAKAILSRATE